MQLSTPDLPWMPIKMVTTLLVDSFTGPLFGETQYTWRGLLSLSMFGEFITLAFWHTD